MTERTLSELADAEVVPNAGGSNAWMVRFGPDDYDFVNKTAKNRLLLEGKVDIRDKVSLGDIDADFDLEADDIILNGTDGSTRVPASKHENVLWAVHDEDGDRLRSLFDELYTPEVRKGLMDQFMPRFRQHDTDISKKANGWLVNGDILVSWDGDNHPVDVAQTHVVSGGKTVEADTDKEAREIEARGYDLGPSSEYEATAPDGRTFTLNGVEARFLVTVAAVLGRNPTNYDDELRDVIANTKVVGFTDTKSGLYHAHGLGKHTLGMLGVTDAAIERLFYNSHDHAGVHEMKARRQEFENAPYSVFDDAANDDPSKWSRIESTSKKAPIPQEVRSDIDRRFQ